MNKFLIALIVLISLVELSKSLKMVGDFYSTEPSKDGRCCSCCPGSNGVCIASCCACRPIGKRNIQEENVKQIIQNNQAPKIFLTEPSKDGRCCSCCPGWNGPCIAACCACPTGK